jgi:hypothetical protein
MYIVLPRLLLAWLETARISRWARDCPVDLAEPYYRRLCVASRPQLGDSARVIPCGLELQPRQLDHLREFLQEVFGIGAQLHFESPVAYGAEEELVARLRAGEAPDRCLVLFNMAATPEAEHQGRLLGALKAMVGGGEGRVVALLEESSYTRRLQGQSASEQQLDKRRKTWQRLAREHAVPLVGLDLDAPNPDYWLEQLRQALSAPRPDAA